MIRLPDSRGLIVAYDTEASGLSTEEGARICSLSMAWRDPATRQIQAIAVPFDMGFEHSSWLGRKELPADHAGRLDELMQTHGRDYWDVVNCGEREWLSIMGWLSRQRLVMHNAPFDCVITSAGLRGHAELGVDLVPGLLWDSKFAQSVLEPDETTSLKPTSVRHHVGMELGFPEGMESAEQEALGPWKGPQADPRYDLIPWRVLAPYATVDAQLTLLLAEWQWQQIEEGSESSAGRRPDVAAGLDLPHLLYRLARYHRHPDQSRDAGESAARPGPGGGGRPGSVARISGRHSGRALDSGHINDRS